MYSESAANILLKVEVADPPQRRAARRRRPYPLKAIRYQGIVAIFARHTEFLNCLHSLAAATEQAEAGDGRTEQCGSSEGRG